MATVIFAHGRDSGPWGPKIRVLARIAEHCGLRVISCDDRDTLDPETRILRLIKSASEETGQILLVGSSMGGYVATVASSQVGAAGLFLMAPAFGMPGYKLKMPNTEVENIEIVLVWDDQIVPEESVFSFARTHRATLHILPASHRLVEELAQIEGIFERFIQKCLAISPLAKPTGRQMACF
ncbi:MAG: alpha/beta hydrolase [Deltaproteobacteria bacterium]|jgi:hypothetical protein|nr:alpha/beta hydrolase [Deltaproteobacteria bacterium]